MNGPPDLPTDRIPLPMPGVPEPAVPLPPVRSPVAAEPTPDEPAAAAGATVGPAPQPRWVKEAVRDMLTPNRKKLVVLSTAGSVVAVGLALNALFSGAGLAPEPARQEQPAEPKTLASAPTEPPAPEVRESTSAAVPVVDPQPVPSVLGGPAPVAVAPTPPDLRTPAPDPDPSGVPGLAIPTVPPPSTTPGPATVATPASVVPSHLLPPAPEPPSTTAAPVAVADPTPIIPAAHTEQSPVPSLPEPKPADPPSGLSVPAPTPPPATDKTEPKPESPAAPVVSATPVIPKPEPVTLTTPPVKPPEVAPATPPVKPLEVTPVGPPKEPLTPAPSTPDLPTPPAPKPVVPTFEPTDRKPDPAPPVPTPADPPATFRPVTTDPLPKPAPEPKADKPPGGSLNLTKPPGELGVRPAGNAESPKTDFDVDLHKPKAGDTYESISKLHYRDARYAEALRQFNRGVELDRGIDVQVPPMYVLRQRFPQLIGAARSPEWTPSAGRERK